MTSPPQQPEEEEEELDDDGYGWEHPVAAEEEPSSSEEEKDGDGKGAVKIEPKEEPKTPPSLLGNASPTQYPCDTTKVCYQWSSGFGFCGGRAALAFCP